MVEGKNQHFVPQSYLRPWSDTNGRVTVFVPENREEYQPTPISNVASENYFYAEHPRLETALSELEGNHESVLKKAREAYEAYPNFSYNGYRNLYSFVLLQRVRTKAYNEDVKLMGSRLAKRASEAVGKPVEEIEEELDGYRDMMKRLMLQSLINPFLIGDLKICILVDTTGTHFVTSTNPVIMDVPNNHLTEKVAGLTNIGLQIFCPISPTHCLFLFDPSCYRTSRHFDEPIPVENSEVTKSINRFLVSHFPLKVFYENGGREDEINRYLEGLSNPNLNEEEIDDLEINEIIPTLHQRVPDAPPELPFVQTTKRTQSLKQRAYHEANDASSTAKERVNTVLSYHNRDFDAALIDVISDITTQVATPGSPIEWNPSQ